MIKTISGNNKFFIKTVLVIAAVSVLFLFKDFDWKLTSAFENIIYTARGPQMPDTNIVLIGINEEDIDQIGPFPIKRSYYALLIQKLTEQKVKKIGLEIFLSPRFVTQTIYDNLLVNEINNSGLVVLSSVAGKIELENEKFVTDSLSYPSPKLLNENFPTGHINFLDGNDIVIPAAIKAFEELEKAFSVKLAGLSSYDEEKIHLNFFSSQNSFKQYSLLELFDGLENNKIFLKDKIVIIGVTDRLFLTGISTAFDDNLAGPALHAFAVDNILQNRAVNTDWVFLSALFFITSLALLILLQTFVLRHPFLIYVVYVIIFLILSYILFGMFYIRLAYSIMILPLFLLFISDIIFFMVDKQAALHGLTNENAILENLFKKKELELKQFEKELKEASGGEALPIVEKIKSLKAEIKKLKGKEEDRELSEVKYSEEEKNFFGIIYRSKIMNDAAELIKKAAPENASILILGESGTGKELAARAVHQLSSRKDNNFVAVNCGALSETLLESELFGHVKGAFTGAVADKAGRFETAHEGTIFLDEIAETNENFQVKLLRVLQSGEFEKVGSSKTIKVDVRIVAATNQNVEQLVKEKKFREDLYYRLNVIKIEMPPLRSRKEDIELFANYFLKNEGADFRLSKSAVDSLNNYNWKGNVRELEGVIKRAVIFAKSAGRTLIQIADLPEEIANQSSLGFDEVVIEMMRNKKFSHASINEITEEIGTVSRTVISENFRGIVFKTYIKNNFDEEKTIDELSASDENEIKERVRSKLNLFIKNIETDIEKTGSRNFDEIKTKFKSKYKNLPQKFHPYLDEVIKRYL